MIQEKTQRVADLVEQLSEALMTAVICAEIRAIAQAELDSVRKSQGVATEATMPISPGATQGSVFSRQLSASRVRPRRTNPRSPFEWRVNERSLRTHAETLCSMVSPRHRTAALSVSQAPWQTCSSP